jgi:hypothetical protein
MNSGKNRKSWNSKRYKKNYSWFFPDHPRLVWTVSEYRFRFICHEWYLSTLSPSGISPICGRKNKEKCGLKKRSHCFPLCYPHNKAVPHE